MAGLVATALAAPGTAALACGGMVSADGTADMQGMSALLSYDGAREDLAVVVSYAAPSGPFAWLMPLPAVPQISQTSVQGLIDGFRITTPPLESDYKPYLGGAGAAAPSSGILELGRTTIGNLEFVTLGATDAGEVATWMQAHHFGFHDTQRESIQGYLTRHWVLVAARTTAAAPASGAIAVRFTFTTPDPVYPLAIAGASHQGTLPMHLLVVTPYRPASVTYPETTVRPASNGEEPSPQSRLELRYASPLTASEREQVGQTVAVPAGSWLTRYDAEWLVTDLRMDLVLKRADEQSQVNFDELYARFQDERDRNNQAYALAATVAETVAAYWLAIALTLLVSGAFAVVLGAALGGFRKTR
jgi:Uncharacterized protein conserved in bacteria (DUF2330)